MTSKAFYVEYDSVGEIGEAKGELENAVVIPVDEYRQTQIDKINFEKLYANTLRILPRLSSKESGINFT